MNLNLKSTVSVQQEIEINLETPAFFKDKFNSITEYLGVIDECTISIYIYEGHRTFMQNDATENRIAEIKKALDKWERISEEEFFEALDKALKDFNFKPSLRHITASNGSEVTI